MRRVTANGGAVLHLHQVADELEGFYLRQHGEEKGRQIACALLEDLMEAGPLNTAPSLSFLGLAVMDELCARHTTPPVLH